MTVSPFWCLVTKLFHFFNISSQVVLPNAIIIFIAHTPNPSQSWMLFYLQYGEMFTFPLSMLCSLIALVVFFPPFPSPCPAPTHTHYITLHLHPQSSVNVGVKSILVPSPLRSRYSGGFVPCNVWSHLFQTDLPASDPFWFITLASLSFTTPHIK